MNDVNIPIILAVIGMFAVLLVVLLLLRLWFVARERGGFQCTLERRSRGRTAWQHGLMRFGTDRLRWFHGLSLRLSPSVVIHRREIVDVERSPLPGTESEGETLCLVRLHLRDGRFEQMVMDTTCGAALNAWMEAAPTGSVVGDAD